MFRNSVRFEDSQNIINPYIPIIFRYHRRIWHPFKRIHSSAQPEMRRRGAGGYPPDRSPKQPTSLWGARVIEWKNPGMGRGGVYLVYDVRLKGNAIVPIVVVVVSNFVIWQGFHDPPVWPLCSACSITPPHANYLVHTCRIKAISLSLDDARNITLGPGTKGARTERFIHLVRLDAGEWRMGLDCWQKC